MSEDKLPVKDASDLFKVKPSEAPLPHEVHTEELDRAIADDKADKETSNINFAILEKFWYGVKEVVTPENINKLLALPGDLKTVGLYGIVILVLALVLYFVLK